MNPRIQELAEQAGFFPELNYDHTKWHAAGHNDLFEKFAELIVRECAELNFRELGLSGSSSFDVGRMIKQHFGVKE